MANYSEKSSLASTFMMKRGFRVGCCLLAGALSPLAAHAEESGLPVPTISPVDINGVELLSGFPIFGTPSVAIGPADRPLSHVVRTNPVGYMYRVVGGPYDGRIEYGPSTGTYSDHVGFVRNGFNIALGFGDDFRGTDITGPSNGFSQANPDGSRTFYCQPNLPAGDPTDCTPFSFRVAGQSFSFKALDRVGNFTDVSKSGNTVAKSGTRWVFTTRDGTQITTVDTTLDNMNFDFPNGLLESIRYPSGLQVTVFYRNGRINIISRNDGFALKYFYESVLGRTGVPENYIRPNKIVAYNSAVDYCDPAAEACTFSRTWPQATFSWTQTGAWNSKYTTAFNVTDSGGVTTRYTLDKYGRVLALKPGASTIDTATYEYCQNFDEFSFPVGHAERVRNCVIPASDPPVVVGESPKDEDMVLHLDQGGGIVWTYDRISVYVSEVSSAWRVATSTGTGIQNTPTTSGFARQEGVHPSQLQLVSAGTPYGMSASFDGTEASRLVSSSQEDAGSSGYQYDARGNVTRITNSGAGMTTRERTANFPATCTNPLTCNRPNWTTDFAGSRTDYTYDPAHGGELTITLPAATTGGVRPKTRLGYQQRYAWIKNSTGAFVQAPTPIWLLRSESYCRAGAEHSSGVGCATASDEVLTTYEYGADSGPNNLILTGKVVTSNGTALRTCYRNDPNGNRISETLPNANLTSCP